MGALRGTPRREGSTQRSAGVGGDFPLQKHWNDVGSFDMMGVLHEADGDGNIKIGDQINVDTKAVAQFERQRFDGKRGD